MAISPSNGGMLNHQEEGWPSSPRGAANVQAGVGCTPKSPSLLPDPLTSLGEQSQLRAVFLISRRKIRVLPDPLGPRRTEGDSVSPAGAAPDRACVTHAQYRPRAHYACAAAAVAPCWAVLNARAFGGAPHCDGRASGRRRARALCHASVSGLRAG